MKDDALALLAEHGGDGAALAQALAIPREQLLDLSSAVSPFAYPLPPVPAEVLQRLPYDSEPLLAAAAAYYGVAREQVLAASGSQHLIQCLPRLRRQSRVLLPAVGYAEHARCWRQQGHPCHDYHSVQREDLAREIRRQRADVLVLIHPNNPTGACISADDVLYWRALLPADGQLIVDEAFIDATPAQSLTHLLPLPGLVVLRSIGKFFGLPGLRLGFLLADAARVAECRQALGPWPVNAVAQWAGEIMLADRGWQLQARQQLQSHRVRQAEVLAPLASALGAAFTQTAFFSALRLPHAPAQALLSTLLDHSIALRYYRQHSRDAWLRISIVNEARNLQRLRQALAECLPLRPSRKTGDDLRGS